MTNVNDNFSSEESDVEVEKGDDINQQKVYLKNLQEKCQKYEKDIKNLQKERKDRDSTIQRIQREIEELQMEIMYQDLKINKGRDVYKELQDKEKNQLNSGAAELVENAVKVEKEIPNFFTRYLNRLMFAKKEEFEGKIDRKKNLFQAVCVKYYKDDPTNEVLGQYIAQSFSLQVFGFSCPNNDKSLANDLKFSDILHLSKEHWKINNIEDYVLTDQDHHDLTLLYKVPIVQYLPQENNSSAIFILRPKNKKMVELMTVQRAAITLVQDNEKQGKIKEELTKIFELIKKVKPGLKSYEGSQEKTQNDDSPVDGTIFNFMVLVSIIVEFNKFLFLLFKVLMLIALMSSAIQPKDERELNKFNAVFTAPSYFSSIEEFDNAVPYLMYDYNDTTKLPVNYHYIPIGKRRIIMNKMPSQKCVDRKGGQLCIYDDSFTSNNIDKTPLYNTTAEAQLYREVPEEEQLNIQGRGNYFDGSGFIYDGPLKLSLNDAKDILYNQLKYGKKGNFFSPESRAFIFHTTYFEPNRHIIIERTLLFELTSSDIVEITDRKTFFKPNSDNEPEDVFYSSINLALLILTVAGYLINLVLNIKKAPKKIKEVFQLRNLLKYFIMGLVVAYFLFIRNQPDESVQQIIESDKFVTFYSYGKSRQMAVTCLSVAFFGHSLTIIRSLVFSSTINMFLNIFAQSYKDFLSFLLLFFASFMGFSFVFWIAFGPYVNYFQDLAGAAFEIFQYFATGNTLVLTQLFNINEFWAVLLIILMCFIIFIQLDALMMSLIQENVRRLSVKSQSASEDKLPFKEAANKILLKAKSFQTKVQRIFGVFTRKTGSKK